MCLVFTDERIEYNFEVTPACLPTSPPVVGTECFVAGWGIYTPYPEEKDDPVEWADNLQDRGLINYIYILIYIKFSFLLNCVRFFHLKKLFIILSLIF